MGCCAYLLGIVHLDIKPQIYQQWTVMQEVTSWRRDSNNVFKFLIEQNQRESRRMNEMISNSEAKLREERKDSEAKLREEIMNDASKRVEALNVDWDRQFAELADKQKDIVTLFHDVIVKKVVDSEAYLEVKIEALENKVVEENEEEMKRSVDMLANKIAELAEGNEEEMKRLMEIIMKHVEKMINENGDSTMYTSVAASMILSLLMKLYSDFSFLFSESDWNYFFEFFSS